MMKVGIDLDEEALHEPSEAGPEVARKTQDVPDGRRVVAVIRLRVLPALHAVERAEVGDVALEVVPALREKCDLHESGMREDVARRLHHVVRRS